MANGLLHLHSNNIVHCDLRVVGLGKYGSFRILSEYFCKSNILVDDSHNARLSDFGCAKVIGDVEYQTTLLMGFLPFMAPELFSLDESPNGDRPFTPASDIYSFGMLAFEVHPYFWNGCSSAHY